MEISSDYQRYKDVYEKVLKTNGQLAGLRYLCGTEAPELGDPDTYFMNQICEGVEAMAHGELEYDYDVAYTLVKVMCQVMPITLDRDLIAKAIMLCLSGFTDSTLQSIVLLVPPSIAKESPVADALKLAKILFACKYRLFWNSLSEASDNIRKAAQINLIRQTICETLSVSHSSITTELVKEFLNKPTTAELSDLASKYGWEETQSPEKGYSMMNQNVVKIAGPDGQDLPTYAGEDQDAEQLLNRYVEFLTKSA